MHINTVLAVANKAIAESSNPPPSPKTLDATSARGALDFPNSCGVKILIAENATAIYIIEVIRSERRIVFGRFLAGSFSSSAILIMLSKPMYAKKINAAAENMPGSPFAISR